MGAAEFQAVTVKQLCQRCANGMPAEAIGLWKGKYSCARCIESIRARNGRRNPQNLVAPGISAKRWADGEHPLALSLALDQHERRPFVPDTHPRMLEYARDYRSIASLCKE